MPPPAEPTYQADAPPRSGDNVALIALIAFVFGVLLNGYIAVTVLGSGDSGGDTTPSNEAPIIVPSNPTVEPTATETPLPDRTTCEEIRGTEYRSVTERDFFRENCINQVEPSPTIDPTELPPLDGGTNTEATDETPTPTAEP
jgi:hypothetical protein